MAIFSQLLIHRLFLVWYIFYDSPSVTNIKKLPLQPELWQTDIFMDSRTPDNMLLDMCETARVCVHINEPAQQCCSKYCRWSNGWGMGGGLCVCVTMFVEMKVRLTMKMVLVCPIIYLCCSLVTFQQPALIKWTHQRICCLHLTRVRYIFSLSVGCMRLF